MSFLTVVGTVNANYHVINNIINGDDFGKIKFRRSYRNNEKGKNLAKEFTMNMNEGHPDKAGKSSSACCVKQKCRFKKQCRMIYKADNLPKRKG